MTTFYEYIKAASSLPSGTVWELITHPKTGGGGSIVVDAITMEIDQPITMSVDSNLTSIYIDDTIPTVIFPDPIAITVPQEDPTEFTVSDQTILEVTP